MKQILAVLLFTISTLSLANNNGCIAITKDQLCLQIDWTEGPYLSAYSKNIVKFKDMKASTEELEVYKSPVDSVQFYGWMVMHAHQHGTRPVTTTLIENGIYENSKIYFMGGMTGTWQFNVKIGSEVFVLHALDI